MKLGTVRVPGGTFTPARFHLIWFSGSGVIWRESWPFCAAGLYYWTPSDGVSLVLRRYCTDSSKSFFLATNTGSGAGFSRNPVGICWFGDCRVPTPSKSIKRKSLSSWALEEDFSGICLPISKHLDLAIATAPQCCLSLILCGFVRPEALCRIEVAICHLFHEIWLAFLEPATTLYQSSGTTTFTPFFALSMQPCMLSTSI